MAENHMKNLQACEKLLHLLVERLGGYGSWLVPLNGNGDPAEEFNAFSLSSGRNVKLADIEALFDNSQRVQELLKANNALLERARCAEAALREIAYGESRMVGELVTLARDALTKPSKPDTTDA